MNSEAYNNAVFLLTQACLGKITERILSISFSMEEKIKYIQIVHLDGISCEEYKEIEELKTSICHDIEVELTNVFLESVSMLKFRKVEYTILDYVTFLRN